MITVILVIVVCVLVLARKRDVSTLRPPLASGALPFLGHALKGLTNLEELFKHVMKFSSECNLRDGVLTIRNPMTDLYLITDPADGSTVLKSCLQKDAFYDYLKPWLGEGLVNASESVWQRHSKLLNPTFHLTVLHSYLPEWNKQARTLVATLEHRVGRGKFDHITYLNFITLQSFCSTAMGMAVDDKDVELRKQYIEDRIKFTEGVLKRITNFWLNSEFVYNWSSHKKMQEHFGNRLRLLTNTIIKKRKDEQSQRTFTEKRFKTFMDYLLEIEEQGHFTSREVQEEVDTFTVAGSDTTSVTLANVLLNVGTYPEVQRKIYDELREIFQGSYRDVEKDDLFQLKYLDAVIKETLRLYPTLPIIGRCLDKDLKLKNYVLSAGSRCFVSVWGMNRHPSWGPDADQFRPERWTNPESPTHQFAAFGFGKRRCIGYNFAMMSMKTTLAQVLRHYRVSGDVTQLAQTMEVIARPVPKDYISIERRTDSEFMA